MNFVLFLITDIIDFMILNYLFSHMSISIRYTKSQNMFFILIHGIILALINTLTIPILNLATCSILIVTFSLQYKINLSRRLVYIALYIGLGFIVEPLCFMLFECFMPPSTIYDAFILIVFICELFRYVIVRWIVLGKSCRMNFLPAKIIIILELIPVLSVVCSCILIKVMQIETGYKTGFLCLFILAILFINNFFVLYIMEQLNKSLEKTKSAEALLYEVKVKDEYYKEINENNIKIARIKHNLKNQLTAFYRAYESDHTAAKKLFKDALSDLSETEYIYTCNAIVNTVLNVKRNIAVKHDIGVKYEILIPESIKGVSPGEIGILYGNLLDNAIDACCLPDISMKQIIMKSKLFSKSALLISCENSIPTNYKPDLTSTPKKPFFLHHHGLNSVREVVNKYSGTIDFHLTNETFSVEVLIYIDK